MALTSIFVALCFLSYFYSPLLDLGNFKNPEALHTKFLEYPSNLSFDQGQNEIRDLYLYVYEGNYVSFKQVGFGDIFLSEWARRMNEVTNGELRQNFENQKLSGWTNFTLDK